MPYVNFSTDLIKTAENTERAEILYFSLQGLAAILANGLDDAKLEEILAVRADFYQEMKHEEAISYQRLNGFQGVLAHMKQVTVKLMDKK